MALSQFHLSPFFQHAGDEFSTLVMEPAKQLGQRMFTDASNAMIAPFDVKETPEAYHFAADVPGFDRDSVKVQVEDGNVLSVTGHRNHETKDASDTFHRVERIMGSFQRKFRLPENADMTKTAAAVKDGVLSISIPKVTPKETPKVLNVPVA